jgi:hypothetical protein
MMHSFGLGSRCVAECFGQQGWESVFLICQKGSCCHFGCVMSVISLYLPEFYCQFGCPVYVWSDCPSIMNLVIIGSFVLWLDAMYSASCYSLRIVLS